VVKYFEVSALRGVKVGKWTFRKSIKVAPGVRVNISKNGGLGVSVGVKGARVAVNAKEVRTTLSIPGTGIQKTDRHVYRKKSKEENKTHNKLSDDELALTVKNQEVELVDGKFTGKLVFVDTNYHKLFGGSQYEATYREYWGSVGNITIKPNYLVYEAEKDEHGYENSFSVNSIVYTGCTLSGEANEDEVLVTINFQQRIDAIVLLKINGRCNRKVAMDIHALVTSYAKQNSVSSKLCFVATVAYGTNDCIELDKLRCWRDSFLRKHWLGKKFIDIYYRHGEKWAMFVNRHPLMKYVIKRLLDVFISLISPTTK